MPPQPRSLQIPEPSIRESPATPEAMSAVTPISQDYNDKLKGVFDNVLKEYAVQGLPHKKTSVLMLSWDKAMDDLGTAGEVEELGKVFEEQFNFTVVKKLIGAGPQNPQLQAHKILTDFVFEYNDPASLLIIYYAGHGIPSDRGFSLAGKRIPTETEEMERRYSIVWGQAEHSIRTAEADILLIFDCCYAAHILKNVRSFRTRNFEFLGACSSGVTEPPGPKSFTTALIWSLKALANGKPFTMQELARKIWKAPNFPESRFPFTCPRDDHCGDSIVLAPIPENVEACNETEFAAPKTEVQTEDEFLDLRFCFKTKLDEQTVQNLAEGLKPLITNGTLHLRTVRWGGLPVRWRGLPVRWEELEVSEKVRHVAANWMYLATGRRLKSPIRTPTGPVPKSEVVQQVQEQGPPPVRLESSTDAGREPELAAISELPKSTLELENQTHDAKRKADDNEEGLLLEQSKRQRLS